ncbi:hypothetical protein [Novilysobacter erysipheiresistens]|uniref:Uncharacterized protein n=1 Tax=Novilysobacter erysipheiresistens TaxID=1749332 RepID=A0ABU7YUF9_9GAMM
MSADLDSLWLAMVGVYGHRWTSSHGADHATGSGEIWARGLSGLSSLQLGVGMDACITSSDPWPPTLPEFRAMCLGVPSLAFVRDDLTRAPEHRNRFTLLVWSYVDAYRIKLVSADQSDRQLRDAYELAREHVMRGGALPEVVAAIEQDKPKPPVDLSPEEKAERLERLRAELMTGTPVTEQPEPETPVIDKAAIEADLQAHYSDRKSAAAGGDL